MGRRHVAHTLRSDITGVLYIPAVEVLVEEVIVFPLVLPNTAVTLTVQLLPALREELVCILAVPITVFVSTDDACESHKS